MKIFSTFLTLFLVFSLGAQSFDKQKMDSLFKVVEFNSKGMGGIAIHRNGMPVYQNNIGFADISSNIQAHPHTKYRIGSISKTFTAAMILQLVEEGKLSLDTRLSEFYPQIQNAQNISIEDLLRHQSGLFNFTDDEAYKEYMEQPRTKKELLQIFKKQDPVFAPGEKNEYSNTNYVLLSFVLEDVEKQSYAEVLKKRILKPLGLKHTGYGGKIDSERSEAYSYIKKKDWEPASETDMSIPIGAGALISTPSDLNLFFTALFKGNIVKPENLEKMKTLKNGYGMGLFSYPFNDKSFYGHTGGIDGFSAMSTYYPEEDLAMTYISNGTDLSPNDIAIGALSIYWGLDYAIPSFDSLDLSTEELKKYEGTYGSETFPLKVKIFVEDGTLMGQATGQPAFPLEAYDEDKFQFIRAGLQLEFSPEEDKMILLQGGNTYQLSRK
ncbi:serine hydrolase domain-containing protein [Salinimicrobium oceani]|uniref:Beta-lactamase family protein n=1 Tax=Salinimicrobium oceani TaxID=2722702 RepID=A0ABX1CY11_9FLAO|nr:serine hydrolase domain-containing protein [Salinimicrobium oceani]NJW53148.1 beta-lactamase family protein [Salinimicrobium oceani]